MNEFNTELVNSFTNLDFRAYFTQAHTRCFSHADVSFMTEFLELACSEEEFIVPHTMLRKYGVVTTDRSNDAKKCLEKNEMVEKKDYLLRLESQQVGGCF
jgi:hypothetical protein